MVKNVLLPAFLIMCIIVIIINGDPETIHMIWLPIVAMTYGVIGHFVNKKKSNKD